MQAVQPNLSSSVVEELGPVSKQLKIGGEPFTLTEMTGEQFEVYEALKWQAATACRNKLRDKIRPMDLPAILEEVRRATDPTIEMSSEDRIVAVQALMLRDDVDVAATIAEAQREGEQAAAGVYDVIFRMLLFKLDPRTGDPIATAQAEAFVQQHVSFWGVRKRILEVQDELNNLTERKSKNGILAAAG